MAGVTLESGAGHIPHQNPSIRNNPEKEFRCIQHLVRSRHLGRTRAGAETREARKGDYHRVLAALASGGHVITTDYYQPALCTATFPRENLKHR